MASTRKAEVTSTKNEVVFKVRSFGDGPAGSYGTWNIGDGTLAVQTQSLPVQVGPVTGESIAMPPGMEAMEFYPGLTP